MATKEAVVAAVAAASSAAFQIVSTVARSHLAKRRHRKRPRVRIILPAPRGTHFHLDNWDDERCEEFFRFTKDEIRLILPYLQLHEITFRCRIKVASETAFCLLLYRLSAPNRYKENLTIFGRGKTWQSIVITDIIDYLVERYRNKLFWDFRRLTYEQLYNYASAIEEVGGVQGVWGFVDGTLRAICRPQENQEFWYSGYKKKHTIKFHAIMCPDGLISHLAGPYEGKLGDWTAWKVSGIQDVLREVHSNASEEPDEQNPDKQNQVRDQLYVYSDPAYTLSYGVMGGYKAQPSRPLNPVLQAINAHMSSLRVSVEHGFGKINSLWQFLDYSRGLKIGLSPIGAYYMVAILLTNIHTCFRGSQVSKKFNCLPPDLQEYLIQD